MRQTPILTALLLYALAAIGLSHVYACDNGPKKPAIEETVYGSCYRSFAPTLNAWNDKVGRVPDGCENLDRDYTVQEAAEDEIPCAIDRGTNETVLGCTQPEERTIYLLGTADPVQQVDTSVHEWVHALADCVYSDRDRDHLRRPLWELYGADTVEILAQADAVLGHCL